MRIAVIAPVQPASFFDLLWQGAWEATFDISPFGVQVENVTTETIDVLAQRAALTDLLTQGFDGIAIAPAHSSALDDLISRHVHAGTAVITFLNDAPASGRNLFVGPDPFQAGLLAGELLSKFMGGRGRALCFAESGDGFCADERFRGAELELRRHSKDIAIEVRPSLTAFLELPEAKLLDTLDGVSGIYIECAGVCRLAERLEQLGVRPAVVSFTDTEEVRPYLERRTVSAIIDGSRFQQGYFAIQKAYEAVLRKGSSRVSDVRIPSSVILASNIQGCAGGQSLNEAFEALVLQRTESLRASEKNLEEANASLARLATVDALTGLVNRRKFEEILDLELERARRRGCVSLLMIDLNRFKELNDCYGHQTGDQALKIVADVLKARCRRTDTCARLGGDEFVIVLPDANLAGANTFRESLNQRANATRVPVPGDPADAPALTLSIGIASYPENASSAEELIALADADMYRVKKAFKASRDGALASR